MLHGHHDLTTKVIIVLFSVRARLSFHSIVHTAHRSVGRKQCQDPPACFVHNGELQPRILVGRYTDTF
jgi:hypothetical protein